MEFDPVDKTAEVAEDFDNVDMEIVVFVEGESGLGVGRFWG